MPKKKTTNQYFHQGVEDAIQLFIVSTDERERNKLFTIIYPAISKISEVWYNKIKPTYVNMESDEIQMDCVTFLLEKLPMIKAGKGKAFSYLTVTARNYYIQCNQIAYKKTLKGYSLDGMHESFDVEDVITNRVEEMEWNGTLFDTFLEYVDENFDDMFTNSKQKLFASILFEKIKSLKFVEEINRRKLLNEMAEETGIDRGIVTKNINRIASFYSTFKDYFETYGVKPMFKEKLFVTKEDEKYIRKHYQHYSKRNGLNGISRRLGIKYEVVKKWVKDFI